MGTTCGTIYSPKSYKDCSQFSLSTNSCCYYKYKNETSCLWLGKPFTGKVDYKGLELFCDSDFVKLKSNWLIITFIFYFFVCVIF